MHKSLDANGVGRRSEGGGGDLNKKKISDLENANNELNRVRLSSYIYYTHTYTYIHFIVM